MSEKKQNHYHHQQQAPPPSPTTPTTNLSGRHSFSRRMYLGLLQRSPDEFLNRLRNNIMQGPGRRQLTLLQLDLLERQMGVDDMTPSRLHNFRSHGDESLLELAAIFHGDVTVMTRLASLCPRLLLLQRQAEYEGQNVLHTLVSKQNLAGVEAVLGHPGLQNPRMLLNGKAVGPCFTATVMMGELPLSVAALTFSLPMVDLLLRFGARLQEVNTRGDTVLHSLLRFAHLYPDREGEVGGMMRELHTRLQALETAPSWRAEPRCVWLMENHEGLTALRLAAALALPSLFQLILQLAGVYCQLDRHDGLFDSLLYDVTEVDPVALQKWRAVNSPGPPPRHRVAPLSPLGNPLPTQASVRDVGCCPCLDSVKVRGEEEEGRRFVSVLEIICETGHVDKAFQILNTYVVRSIVKAKWRHYRWWFFLWALVHVVLMVLLTVHAVFKARLIRNVSSSFAATSSHGRERAFVGGMAVVTVPLSAVMVVWEGMRLWRGMSLHLRLIHHNGLYRLQLVLLAVSLVVDSVWYWVSGPVNNYFLTLALLVGWWFCTFFLRPWQKFSFFTVMLQKVLLGDMLRFSAIILLELLAFSVAMYITFLATPGPLPEEFQDLPETLLTLFKLMLGLGEVEALGKASDPWLSTLLFVLFVVLSNLLMLNALIAMMSSTCSLVSENKVSQWELQRLSVVLLIESMLPCQRLLYNAGQRMYVKGFNVRRKVMAQEMRYFTKVMSVQTSYTEGGTATLKRMSMIQTQRFPDMHASLGHVTTWAHHDHLASLTDEQAQLERVGMYAHHDLSESPHESPAQVPYGWKPFSAKTRLHDGEEKLPNRRGKADLPAIQKNEEGGPEPGPHAHEQAQLIPGPPNVPPAEKKARGTVLPRRESVKTQPLNGRQLPKAPTELPSPDVFIISQKAPSDNSEA